MKPKKMIVRIDGGRVFVSYEDGKEHEIPAQETHDFWRNPKKHYHHISTEDYRKGGDRSVRLVELFNKYCSKTDKILDLGCSVGRNLHYLYEAGYKNLTGVEINPRAVELGKEYYPNTVAKIPVICSTIEDYLIHVPENSFDVVFTMTVLMHIHPSSLWIFGKIPHITKKHLIIVEEEEIVSETVFPYDFKAMFEECGVKQIHEECVDEENTVGSNVEIKIQYRVFKK